MKNRRNYALALVFFVTSSANIAWATSANVTLEEECRAWAIEQLTPEEEVANVVAECVAAELEAQKQDEIEEECRILAVEQQTPDDEIENFVAECIAVEFGAQQEMAQEDAEQPAQQ